MLEVAHLFSMGKIFKIDNQIEQELSSVYSVCPHFWSVWPNLISVWFFLGSNNLTKHNNRNMFETPTWNNRYVYKIVLTDILNMLIEIILLMVCGSCVQFGVAVLFCKSMWADTSGGLWDHYTDFQNIII